MIPTTVCIILQKQFAKEMKPVTNDHILQDSIEIKIMKKYTLDSQEIWHSSFYESGDVGVPTTSTL